MIYKAVTIRTANSSNLSSRRQFVTALLKSRSTKRLYSLPETAPHSFRLFNMVMGAHKGKYLILFVKCHLAVHVSLQRQRYMQHKLEEEGITVIKQSEAFLLFDRQNNGIANSIPARGMTYIRVILCCAALCGQRPFIQDRGANSQLSSH